MRKVTKEQYNKAVAAIRDAGNFAGGGPVGESGGDWEDYYLLRGGRKVRAASAVYNELSGKPFFEVDDGVYAVLFKLSDL